MNFRSLFRPRRPENVFVLCTGRCGSVTFSRACSHIVNFTSGHETRTKLLGAERLAYPAHHIEADNRLSWFLGRLDQEWGKDAFYVHLTRDRDETAQSYAKRSDLPGSIAGAYRSAILMNAQGQDILDVSRDYVDTVNANIASFLKDKPNTIHFHLENAKEDFAKFWRWIGAEGNLAAALAEWDVRHNESPPAAHNASQSASPSKLVSPKRTAAEEYWEKRKNSLYFQAIRILVSKLGANAGSIIDVGSASCPYLDWYDWIPQRTSLDLRNPYQSSTVHGIKANFLDWTTDRTYDIATCLQVLEHIPDAQSFAQKILAISNIAIVSVPYKWKPGRNSSHVHDPVDEKKMLSWFGREPNFTYQITEVESGSPRLIQVYERESATKWRSLAQRRRLEAK